MSKQKRRTIASRKFDILRKSFGRLAFNRFSWIALLFVGLSLWIYFQHPSLYPLETKRFVFFAAISYCFWTATGVVINGLPRGIHILSLFLLSFIVVLAAAATVPVFKEFKEFLPLGVVRILKDQPVYFKGYVEYIATHPLPAIGLAGGSYLLFLFLKKDAPAGNTSRLRILIGAIILLLCNTALNSLLIEYQRYFIPADIHSFYSIRQGLTQKDATFPLTHIKSELAQMPKGKWNVVVFIFESLSKEPLSFYGYSNDYTPYWQQWIAKEDSNFVLMQNSISVSGATDVSMPAIFTGVGPEQAYQKLITAPFIWEYAKASGYRTVYFTSQSQSWKNFSRYIGDGEPDEYYYLEKLGCPIVNDAGADDLIVADSLVAKTQDISSPFMLIFNTNATHGPFQQESADISSFGDIDSRYGRALYITDRTIKKIVEHIRQLGEMDRTVFVFTADHGNYSAKRRSRLSSFYREALEVPMMFRFPDEWIKENPKKWEALRQNASQPVSNLDLAPTIYEIITGIRPDSIRFFDGQSLLRPIHSPRRIICLSTNDTRTWSSEGFGIYEGNHSFLFHDHNGFEFYDLKNDPRQLHNLIDSMPPALRQHYDSIVFNNPYLKAVYDRHKTD